MSLFACKGQKQFSGSVNFETVTVSWNSADVDPDTTKNYRVDIEYLSPLDAPQYLNDSIIETMLMFFSSWFILDNRNFNLNSTVKANMLSFLDNINKMPLSGDSEVSRHFVLRINPETSYQNKRLISISYDWSIYEGGLHGNFAKFCVNFNKSDGSKITYEQLAKDKAELLAVAEAEFRASQGMSSDESMYQIYNFKDNTFMLPENFAFTDKGLTFYYNPYEIAPYSAGLIEFVVPYEKVKKYINFLK